MGRRSSVLAGALAIGVMGCAQVQELPGGQLFGPDGPKAVVGKALTALADHDLGRAREFVCPEQRNAMELPVPIPQFGLARLPGLTSAEALSVVGLDFSDLQAVETQEGADNASVGLSGAVGLDYDPAAVRALAVKLTGGTDPDTVETVMAVIGEGQFNVSYATSVFLSRLEGRWFICGGQFGERLSGQPMSVTSGRWSDARPTIATSAAGAQARTASSRGRGTST